MPADEIAQERSNPTRRRSTSWWPYLISSVFHIGIFGTFLQFGSPGGAGPVGPRPGGSISLVGRFLESGDDELSASDESGPALNLVASMEETPAESEEPAKPVDEPEQPPASQDHDAPPLEPPEPVRRRSRNVRNVAHIVDAELEPPPDEPREGTVIEEPAPPRRRSGVTERTRPARANSPRTTSQNAVAGIGGIGRGTGREGSGDGVGFFGLEAKARTVVYVIDASSSMEPHAAMAQAIAELEASLDSLPPTARYGIVFFNNVPTVLPASGAPQPFANTPRNRRLAQQFIASVVPDAGSDRLAALMAALAFKPDCIFLLTDAGDPPLDAAELEAFRRRNRGNSPVHIVEFGVGVQLVRANFLTRLARQTAGGYRYVDVTAE